MKEKKTTIAVSKKNWTRLNSIREVGESMDDILGKVLDIALNMREEK